MKFLLGSLKTKVVATVDGQTRNYLPGELGVADGFSISVTTKITNSDGCRVWEVIEREDTLVAAAGFESAVLPIPMRQ